MHGKEYRISRAGGNKPLQDKRELRKERAKASHEKPTLRPSRSLVTFDGFSGFSIALAQRHSEACRTSALFVRAGAEGTDKSFSIHNKEPDEWQVKVVGLRCAAGTAGWLHEST